MTLTERAAFKAIDFYLVNQKNVALDKSELIDLAKAIIPIVLEEAAKVADGWAERANSWKNKFEPYDDFQTLIDMVSSDNEELAAAIRALAEDKP